MRFAAFALAVATLATAGSAVADTRLTDLEYLRASRCKGIAQQLGGADTTNLDALLKAARRGRSDFIVERGESELQRARREARGDRKDKLTAELTGGCAAFLSGQTAIASTR